MATNKRSKRVVGWKENAALPDLNIKNVIAKIDTGATISALHATHIKEFYKNNEKYVRFRLHQESSYKIINKPVLGYKTIKNSFGEKQSRPLISISIKIGNNTIETIITLAKRSNMTYPVLIGRSSLKKNYRINPKKSYLTGKIG